jgi:hypothetical protein
LTLEQLFTADSLHVRVEYWLAFRRGARLPQLWDLAERDARELAAMPEGSWEEERRRLEHVERAALRTLEWISSQEDPGEARRGLGRPGSPYWAKWIKDRVWERISYFRPVIRESLLDLPAGRPLLARVCDRCGERSVVEDEFDQLSRCLGCGAEAPHDELPF